MGDLSKKNDKTEKNVKHSQEGTESLECQLIQLTPRERKKTLKVFFFFQSDLNARKIFSSIYRTSVADFFGASLEIIVFSVEEGWVFPYKW